MNDNIVSSIERLSQDDRGIAYKIGNLFSDYVEEIEDMGYNPFKGM